MTKMISKFHVLIQSKMVWIVFVAVIVVSFILLPVAANLSNRDKARENAPGMLNGKAVPREEYEAARTRTYLSLMMMSLMYGQEFQFTDEIREYVNEVAWKRLITLRKAAELGFKAYDPEVADYIKSFPLFSPEGTFDPNIYALFKERFLKARGFSVADFESYAAEEVLLQKTQQMVGDMALIPPARIDRSIEMLTTEFKLEYAVLTTDSVTNLVTIAEQDARSAYEQYGESFTKPGRIDLKYVYFPYESFLGATEDPAEDELQDYYNNNLGDYKTSETNTVADAPQVDSPSVSYKPFEEVRSDISETLKQRERAALALDAANAMVFELPPDRNGRARAFEDVAAEMDIEVQDIAAFSIDDVPQLEDSPELVASEANQLRPNPDEYFSDAVPAESGVYILALEKLEPEFIPAFEEVSDEAFQLARRLKTETVLNERISELREQIEERLTEGTSFAEVAEEFGMQVEATDKFTMQTASEVLADDINGQALNEQIIFLNEGELTDPVQVDRGRLLAYVAERAREDAGSTASMRDMLHNSLSNDVVSKLYDNWQNSLLEEANFENLRDDAEEGQG